jgi:hypothetical protein
VLLRKLPARLQQLEADEAKPLAFEASDDLAAEASLHGVRLEKDQRLLHGCISWV